MAHGVVIYRNLAAFDSTCSEREHSIGLVSNFPPLCVTDSLQHMDGMAVYNAP